MAEIRNDFFSQGLCMVPFHGHSDLTGNQKGFKNVLI